MLVPKDGKEVMNVSHVPAFLAGCCGMVKCVRVSYVTSIRCEIIPAEVFDLIRAIQRSCPLISELEVSEGRTHGEILLALTLDMPNLVNIKMNCCPKITSSAFQNISAGCPKLEAFNALGCKIGHDVLAGVTAGCPLLADLSCALCDNDDVGPVTTCLFPRSLRLRRLQVEGLASTDMECIASNCLVLDELIIGKDEKVSTAAWVNLFRSAACRKLKKLYLYECKHTDWAAFAEVHNLRTLSFDRCGTLTETSLLSVAQANATLFELNVTNCYRVSYLAVLLLLDACPWLRDLCIATKDEEFNPMTQLVRQCLGRLYPHMQSLEVDL
jgi:hypothetical protein